MEKNVIAARTHLILWRGEMGSAISRARGTGAKLVEDPMS